MIYIVISMIVSFLLAVKNVYETVFMLYLFSATVFLLFAVPFCEILDKTTYLNDL